MSAGGGSLLLGIPSPRSALGAVLEGCEEMDEDHHLPSTTTTHHDPSVTGEISMGGGVTTIHTGPSSHHHTSVSSSPTKSSPSHIKRPPLSPPPTKPSRFNNGSSSLPVPHTTSHVTAIPRGQLEAALNRLDSDEEHHKEKEINATLTHNNEHHHHDGNSTHNNAHIGVSSGGQQGKQIGPQKGDGLDNETPEDDDEELQYLNETFDDVDDGGDGGDDSPRHNTNTYQDRDLMMTVEPDANANATVPTGGENRVGLELDIEMEREGDISHGILFSNSNDDGSPQRVTGQGNDVRGVGNIASDDDDELLWQASDVHIPGQGQGQGGNKVQVIDGGKGEEAEEEEGEDVGDEGDEELTLALSEDSFDMLGKLLHDLPPVGIKKAPPPPRPLLTGTELLPGRRIESKRNNHFKSPPPKGVSSPSKRPTPGKIVATSLSKPLTLSPRGGTIIPSTTTASGGMGAGGVGTSLQGTSVQLSVSNSMTQRHPSPGSIATGGQGQRTTMTLTPDAKKKTTATTITAIPKQFAFPSASVPASGLPLSAALTTTTQHGQGKVGSAYRNGKSPY